MCVRELNFLPHYHNLQALPYVTSLDNNLLPPAFFPQELLSFNLSRQTLGLLGTKKRSESAQKILHLACSGLNEIENDG